jgi:hypothetical protein
MERRFDRLRQFHAKDPIGPHSRGGTTRSAVFVAGLGACAIAIAPSVAPPHVSAERAVTLVAETRTVTTELVTSQAVNDLTAGHDALRPVWTTA